MMAVHLSLGALDSSVATSPPSPFDRKTLNALSIVVAKAKRVVVVTGAGISCSSGIPDFRSSDGLYALVKSRYPNVVLKGRDLFSASLFREPESTRLFYSFIAELKMSVDAAKPAPTHHFIKTLDNKGKLLRSYTQNIDGFEEKVHIIGAGSAKGKGKKVNIKEIKNVQLHGDIHRVRCTMCSAESACGPEYLAAFREGIPPNCPECTDRCNARVARMARPLTIGTLRPNIVLYDEAHPLGEEIGNISTRDISRKPDMLIIMGTSLKVHGIKKLVKDFAVAVHSSSMVNGKSTDGQNASQSSPPMASSSKRPSSNLLTSKNPRLVVFVNRTAPPADLVSIIDYWVEGDTDTWVAKCEADWRRSRPQDWETQPTLFNSLREKEKEAGVPPLAEEINTLKIVKGVQKPAKPKPKSKSTQGKNVSAISGSENALPVSIPLPPSAPSSPERIISRIPKSRLSNNAATSFMGPPRSTASTPSSSSSSPSAAGSAIEPWPIPIPVSPKKRHPTGSQQTLVGSEEDEEPIGSGSAIVVDELSALRPRKKRVVRALPLDDEDEEPITTGLLFGSRRGLNDMSLDDIDVVSPTLSQSSQMTAVDTRASRSKTEMKTAASSTGQKSLKRDTSRSSRPLGTSHNPIYID